MSPLRWVLFLAAIAGSCLAQSDGVVRLNPAGFPNLPRNLAAEVQRRGCTVPQVPMIDGLHNVIKGEFAKPGQTDWAVLCSVDRVSSILIFWNGVETNPAEIARQPDSYRIQSWTGNDNMAYSRNITPVGQASIMEHYNAYGGEKPPSMDHQGIDDAFVGKASEVLYFYQGKWLHLSGAD
jgi:hypothetical protein